MANVNTGNGVFVSGSVSYVGECFLQFVNYMISSPAGPGWILAGSNNTSTGTMGENVLSSATDFTTNTWFVLETPDRMLQLLFNFTSTTSVEVYINNNSDYFGGGNSTIPSTTDGHFLVHSANIVTGSGNAGFHCTASNSYPYNFAWFSNTYNSNSRRGGFALIFLNDKAVDSYEYIVTGGTGAYAQTSLEADNSSIFGSGSKGIFNDTVVPIAYTVSAIGIGSSSIEIPSDVGYSETGADMFFPSIFYNIGFNSYIGATDFMLWTSSQRSSLQTFGSNVVFDDVAFPWSGDDKPSYDPK